MESQILNEYEPELVRLADKIKQLGLTAPCLFLIEAHRPFRGVAEALFPAVEPFFRIVGAQKAAKALEKTISSPEAIEELISFLEEPSKEVDNEKR